MSIRKVEQQLASCMIGMIRHVAQVSDAFVTSAVGTDVRWLSSARATSVRPTSLKDYISLKLRSSHRQHIYRQGTPYSRHNLILSPIMSQPEKTIKQAEKAAQQAEKAGENKLQDLVEEDGELSDERSPRAGARLMRRQRCYLWRWKAS